MVYIRVINGTHQMCATRHRISVNGGCVSRPRGNSSRYVCRRPYNRRVLTVYVFNIKYSVFLMLVPVGGDADERGGP